MSELAKGPQLFMNELVDAVRYSQAWAQSVKEREALEERASEESHELDELASRISDSFDGIHLNGDATKHLSSVINEFTATAIQQQKEKIGARTKALAEEASKASETERLRAVRSLEAYLAATPLPVLDEQLSLDLSDNSYTASVECKCAGTIEYKFLLNTASSRFFRSGLTLSLLRKGLKLPVRLGKVWLRKESVADFEKLDGYVLASARASRKHLVSTFSNRETGALVNAVFSRSDENSSVTVEYADSGGKVDVTGEPGLSKHFDAVVLKEVMGQLFDVMWLLKEDKIRLDGLEVEGKDVLASMDFMGFMQRVTLVIVQSDEMYGEFQKLDRNRVREKLGLLGAGGSAMFERLGFGQRPRSKNVAP